MNEVELKFEGAYVSVEVVYDVDKKKPTVAVLVHNNAGDFAPFKLSEEGAMLLANTLYVASWEAQK